MLNLCFILFELNHNFFQNLPKSLHIITMGTIDIFCNRCFREKDFDQGSFYISSCYHILCGGCRGNSVNVCPCCNQSCQFLEINNNLPANVKAYFMIDMTDQRCGSVQKIWKFQTQQYRIWMQANGHHTADNCNKLIEEAEPKNLRRQKMNERLQQEANLKRKLDDSMR